MGRLPAAWTWLCSGLLLGGCGIVEAGSAGAGAGLTLAPPQHFQRYVLGLPVHVVLELTAAPGLSFKRLRFPDWLDLHDALALELQRGDGQAVSSIVPRPRIDDESGALAQSLEDGERRRMLVDLSPLLPAHLEAGEYWARLGYVEPRGRVTWAERFVLRLRQPSAAERERTERLAPDRAAHRTWSEWQTACPATPGPAPEPQDLSSPLGFALRVRALLCGSGPWDRISESLFDGLPPMLQPEMGALKLEWQRQLSPASPELAARREALARAAPGLAWWLRALDSGGVYLAGLAQRR